MIPIYISAALVILIVISNLVLLLAFLIKKNYRTTSGSQKISVIVAAKNESENIRLLVDALACQNYPKDLYEVIIVDDNSNDGTFEFAEEKIVNLTNFRIFKAEEKEFPAKRGAIDFGIKKAANPFILITDADCLPEKNWISEFSGLFNKNYDFIFGVAPFLLQKNLISQISGFENLRSSILTFGFANLKLPFSASARSFGFKKKSFEKIKGYKNTIDTLSGDDDLLLREAVKHNLKIGTIIKKDAFVYSKTETTLASYLKQKARHTTTSFHYLFVHKLFLGFWHLLNLVGILCLILSLFNPFFLTAAFAKFFGDFLIVLIFQNKFGYKFNISQIFYLQILYEIFLVINFFNAKYKTIEWK